MNSFEASTLSSQVFLRAPFYELLSFLPKLGAVCASTANQSASLIRYGVYWEQWPGGKEWRGGVSSSNVRHLLNRWRSASVQSGPGYRSLRFLDDFGVPLHEVRLQEPSYFQAFDAVIGSFTSFTAELSPKKKWPNHQASRAEVDVPALCRAWDSIAYLGEFSGLLRSFGLNRTQAFRCIGKERAAPVSKEDVVVQLRSVVENQVPIRVLVNSSGALQTHGSIFRTIHQEGNWLRLEKPHASFQVNIKDIASAWVVKRPSQRGDVLSLEIFDANDNTIALFLYHGTADHPDYTTWRRSLSLLSSNHKTQEEHD